MKPKEPVDVLSDEGHKRLKTYSKKKLIGLVEDLVVTYRLRFTILESVGIDYKKIIKNLDDDKI